MDNPPVALILAAGMGTRLLPMTEERPKCLIELLGRPLLAHQLEAIRSCGLREVVMVIGYQGEKIVDFIEAEQYDGRLSITFVENECFKETASCYSFWLAREYLKCGYIHLNSDLVFSPELLTKLVSADREDAIITSECEIAERDMVRFVAEGDRIVRLGRFAEIGPASGFLIGPAKFSAKGAKMLIRHIGAEIHRGILDNACYLAFAAILNHTRFCRISAGSSFWKEIDTPEDLEVAERLLSPEFVKG